MHTHTRTWPITLWVGTKMICSVTTTENPLCWSLFRCQGGSQLCQRRLHFVPQYLGNLLDEGERSWDFSTRKAPNQHRKDVRKDANSAHVKQKPLYCDFNDCLFSTFCYLSTWVLRLLFMLSFFQKKTIQNSEWRSSPNIAHRGMF